MNAITTYGKCNWALIAYDNYTLHDRVTYPPSYLVTSVSGYGAESCYEDTHLCSSAQESNILATSPQNSFSVFRYKRTVVDCFSAAGHF